MIYADMIAVLNLQGFEAAAETLRKNCAMEHSAHHKVPHYLRNAWIEYRRSNGQSFLGIDGEYFKAVTYLADGARRIIR